MFIRFLYMLLYTTICGTVAAYHGSQHLKTGHNSSTAVDLHPGGMLFCTVADVASIRYIE